MTMRSTLIDISDDAQEYLHSLHFIKDARQFSQDVEDYLDLSVIHA